MEGFNYEIIEHYGVLKETKNSTIECNLVSFNHQNPKIDIRRWMIDENGEKIMGKGITLSKSETEKLKNILIEIIK